MSETDNDYGFSIQESKELELKRLQAYWEQQKQKTATTATPPTDGGPAYPSPNFEDKNGGMHWGSLGMSLRDVMAKAALSHIPEMLRVNDKNLSFEMVADWAGDQPANAGMFAASGNVALRPTRRIGHAGGSSRGNHHGRQRHRQ